MSDVCSSQQREDQKLVSTDSVRRLSFVDLLLIYPDFNLPIVIGNALAFQCRGDLMRARCRGPGRRGNVLTIILGLTIWNDIPAQCLGTPNRPLVLGDRSVAQKVSKSRSTRKDRKITKRNARHDANVFKSLFRNT